MNKKAQIAKYVISDFISASIVWILFNLLRYHEIASYLGYSSLKSYLLSDVVFEGQLLVPFFWLILHSLSGYYNKPFGKSRIAEFFTTFITVLIGVTSLFFIMILNDLPRSFQIYYELYFSLLALQFLLTYIPRLIVTQIGLSKIRNREWSQNVLIIGAGSKAQRIADSLYDLGYTISGFIPEDDEELVCVDENRIAGTLNELSEIVISRQIHEIVVAIESPENEKQVNILYSLYRYALPIKVLADKSTMLNKVKIKTILGAPLINVSDNNFSEVEKNIKFVLDKVFSFLVLVLLSPLFLYLGWRVKRGSPGPVFFSQERIGYMGKPFMMYKFRTMYQDSEQEGPLLASENDSRITPFGRLLRKYRLDEIPQFWNVLKGDMSLVGPRPERKYYIDQIVKKAPYYYLLHNVRPGITSWGMVKYGYAGNVDEMVERLEYDMLYYENMSLVLDLTILIYTVKTVVTGKGI
ncbi:exopolysaccharide biosynthesis polyprenyl glycosylphosphotransferase [Parabacteroides sp. PF5-5]|uniref:sugar transferase n=1 Tax=unclassified Parabacteroides TaxID=2649774 RepID=UPI002474F9B0|nr:MULTISPECIES: sugar transferase [unclassified Parabacteroides]MDH6303870.1 exopolysaccharide biosynthesis polyprenyl glycosylphosphotransferase [Parabacteroides sp. PH5-39]MDH6314487.1 exopolysaccharide biosynthesis polyprenyl glycosylphosphotransferase [Parabacteroides sp. PF5-13]MDH6318448.1 exopolysaccharide biosynthesis polyprenyl glycosylphosphotransferase [Parabacteroides sp. PH5-13]MDH6322259.1 exopolysaccharide biosynthesis polyprenyl glycosylphosphotransferase [Parabacteroides sp. P